MYFTFVRLFDSAHGYMYICILHYINYYFPDFVPTICLGFIFDFLFLNILFNLTECHNKPLVESLFLTQDQALRLSSGSTDFNAPEYQRTNPRDCQIVRTDTKEAT